MSEYKELKVDSRVEDFYRTREYQKKVIENIMGIPSAKTKTYGPSWAWFGIYPGMFWFRIFGYGLHFKNWKKNDLLFSERYFWTVKKRVLIVGFVIVKVLKPEPKGI